MEAKSIRESKIMKRCTNVYFLSTTAYRFFPTEDMNGLSLVDNNGFYTEYEDVQAVITGLQNYLASVTKEEIIEANKETELKRTSSYPVQQERVFIKKSKPGFIYFVLDHSGYCKIGQSKDVEKRMGEYTKLPHMPTLHHSLGTEDMDGCEQYFHEKYALKRLRGEWFNLNESDLKYIKEKRYLRDRKFIF